MKMNNSGFTLIELMIVLAIIGIVVSLAAPVAGPFLGLGVSNRQATNSDVVHPAYPQASSEPEMKCIGGYKFMFNPSGQSVQVMDAGNAVKCEK